MQTKKEQFLLLRIRSFDDKAAFQTLLSEHSEKLLRFLSFKLPRREDAEDTYSIVCIQLWDYLTRNEVQHFSGLLFTIARSAIATFYAQRTKRPTISLNREDGTELPIASPAHTVERMTDKIDAGFLREKMKELSDDDQEVIMLRYLDGYSVKDIAKYFGKSENATSVMLHRAIAKLKELYERP